jgi:hypothetical protein
VERSHRIDAEEFYRLLDGAVIDDAGVPADLTPAEITVRLGRRGSARSTS